MPDVRISERKFGKKTTKSHSALDAESRQKKKNYWRGKDMELEENNHDKVK